MAPLRIGTVDIPERVERERYFKELDHLELSALFTGPLKPGSLARWKEMAPPGALALVAPWVLTHRRPPRGERLWRHDANVGDFRDSAPGRAALGMFRDSARAVAASHVIFSSPPLFAPSMANREQLRAFFAEVATEEAAGAPRVWIPDGLWEPRTAVTFATEIGVTCAIDPLVHDPGVPAEVYEDLQAPALYFRITGPGRSGPIQSEKLEDLAALVEHYEDIELSIAFASSARWQDARNFRKLLGGSTPELPEASDQDGQDEEE